MSQKTVEVEGIGTVVLKRRKGTRNIRLSMRPDGSLRVGMPAWMPYRQGVAFVRSQYDWVTKHRPVGVRDILVPDMPIGKAHRLLFTESETTSRVVTRLVGDEIRVIHPVGMLYKDPVVQDAAERACVRALKQEAEHLLPIRLAELAKEHGFDYRSVAIKRLQSRWGSCSSHKDIVLNCHLMDLSWELIDYVLLHELLHTRIMRHGQPFWSELARYVPNLSHIRKQIKQYHPYSVGSVL